MGIVGELLSFVRGDVEGTPIPEVKLDPGGGDNLTAEVYHPAGYDAQPLAGDFIVTVTDAGTGRVIATGYLDPVNEGTAEPGETRLYSRDSEGAIQVTLKLDSSGIVNLGEDLAADFVALAAKVNAEMDALRDIFDNHIHTTTAVTGGGGSAGVISAPTATAGASNSVAAEKVKAT